jgi:hypothetical protein
MQERQAAFGLQLRLSAEDRRERGEQQKFIRQESTPEIVRTLEEPPSKSHYQSGDLSVGAWFEAPMIENFWASIYAEYYVKDSEFKREKRKSTQVIRPMLGQKKSDIIWWTFEPALLRSVNAKNEHESTRTGAIGTVYINFPSKLYLISNLYYYQYDYISQNIDGPDSTMIAKLLIYQKLPLNFELGGLGNIESQSGYLFHNLPTKPVISADVTTMQGEVYLSVYPLPWLKLAASQKMASKNFSSNDPVDQDVIERNVPDYTSELSLKGSVIMRF